MKKYVLLLFTIAFYTSTTAQKTYTKEELLRLQDLGRLWGMVHYFHPAMGTGRIVTDSLIISNAASLAANPSAQNFTTVVTNMLAQLNDPATGIKTVSKSTNAVLFTSKNEAVVKKFPNGYWYIALPTAALENEATLAVPSLMPDAWDSAKGIVLDLRNVTSNANYDYTFLDEAFELVKGKLAGNTPLPAIYERSVYHSGLVNQANGTGNVYNSGWRTATKGTAAAQIISGQKPFAKPFAFVVNEGTNTELVKVLLPLQAAKKCLIFYEGDARTIPTGSAIEVAIADGQKVNLRVSDRLIGDGASIPKPDLVVSKIEDSSWQSGFITQAFAALDGWDKTTAATTSGNTVVSLNYILPKPAAYAENMAPPVGHRLFALFNYWNAIQYFFGYKNLLPEPWDNKLLKHIPHFIAATDGVKYQLAIRHLASDIHDSHGFVSNTNSRTPIRDVYGYWPPVTVEFIGNKLYIVDIGKDSLQSMSNVDLWDEIEAINGETVAAAAQKWRTYIASSNESTFKRDVVNTIINGAKDSKLTLTLNRNGVRKNVELVRTGRNQAISRKNVDFNDDYPVFKKLEGNIGYVNMGSLKTGQVDSMFQSLMNTKAIIFDIRNYPNGTAWSIAPRLAAKEKKAVRFEAPMVTADWITGDEGAEQALFYFTVRPDTTKPRYKGKVIILCNQQTQSQAEYSIMMFQGAADVTVIGSQTAGADGNVTNVVLPGGYIASFSGAAVIYPDGKGTQRTGIRVDVQAVPTLAGLKAGKDEVLERALQYLKTGK